jgi:MoaA/NifB/PqqE/SkfB family radical SAM enzyme
MSKCTYCKYPFNQLAMKSFQNNKLQAFWPCCNMGNGAGGVYNPNMLGVMNADELTPEEMFNHPRMEKLRENLKNGIKDPACSVCWRIEDEGLTSYRMYSFDENEPLNYNAELEMIDITISNICNLRCRMCTPGNSNLLMKDHKYFEENNLIDDLSFAIKDRWSASIPHATHQSTQWKWLMENPDKIKILKMSGGEPFYDKQVIKLLQTYIDNDTAKDITLAFHTNATQFNDTLIQMLKEFKSNEHTLSIDGVGKVYDYIRYPGTFDEMKPRVEKYVNEAIDKLNWTHFNFVLTSLNVLNINEYIDWILSLGIKPALVFTEVYPTERGIALKRLPVNILEQAKERILPYTKMEHIDYAVEELVRQIDSAVKNNDENKDLMLKEITLFDKSRNQSYKDFLDPLLVGWLDN